MNTRYYFCSKGNLLALVVGIISIGTTSTVFAADDPIKYVPLIGIPGVSDSSSLPTYINNIYRVTIGVGAIFAVVKIALAGVKYSMSGVVTDKAEAKKDIQGVLLGLAILLLPALVLGTINPKLLNLDVLGGVGKVGLGSMSGTYRGPSIRQNYSSTPGKDITVTDPNAIKQVQATKTVVTTCSGMQCRDATTCEAGGRAKGTEYTWVENPNGGIGTCYK